jgi:hypothetical protein
VEELNIKITSETEQATDGASKLASGLSALGGIAMGVLSAGLAVGLAGIVALTTGLGFAVSEAAEAEVVLAQLNAVVRSMGTGFDAAEIVSWAEDLSLATGIADDAITGAANILLTFGNIGREVFDETLSLTADLAVAWRMDLTSAATMVGKAVNDPIAGLTALTRVGITFTEEQKEMITAMVEAGNAADAQAMIMAELTRQVGGSAEAFGDTLTGSLSKIKNIFGEVAESIGSLFVPAIKAVIDFVLPPLMEGLEFVNTIVEAVKAQFEVFSMQVAAGVDPVLAFGNVLLNLFPEWLHESVMTLIEGLLSLRNAFVGTGDQAGSLMRVWGDTFKVVLMETLPNAIAFAGESLGYFADLWAEFGPDIIDVLKMIAVAIQAVAPHVGAMVDNWTKHTQLMRAAFRGNVGALGHDMDTITGQLVPLFTSLGNQAIQGLTRSLYANSGLVKEAFKHLAKLGISAFVELLGIRSPSKVFAGFGRNVVDGLVSGISEDPSAMYDALKGVVDIGIRNIKNDLGIASPSKLFAGLGADMIHGLEIGLSQTAARSPMMNTLGIAPSQNIVNNNRSTAMSGTSVVVNYPAQSLTELLFDVSAASSGF